MIWAVVGKVLAAVPSPKDHGSEITQGCRWVRGAAFSGDGVVIRKGRGVGVKVYSSSECIEAQKHGCSTEEAILELC